MNVAEQIKRSFAEKNWIFLKEIPKTANYKTMIAMNAFIFLPQYSFEEQKAFFDFSKKNNIEFKVQNGTNGITSIDYLLQTQKFEVINIFENHNLLTNDEYSKILNDAKTYMQKIASNESMQKEILDFIVKTSEKNKIKEEQWHSFLPFVMIFNLMYEKPSKVVDVVKQHVDTLIPGKMTIFTDPVILSNPSYIYATKIQKLIENRLFGLNEKKIEIMCSDLYLLSKKCDISQKAIRPDGTLLDSTEDVLSSIKLQLNPKLAVIFEKMIIDNFLMKQNEIAKSKEDNENGFGTQQPRKRQVKVL